MSKIEKMYRYYKKPFIYNYIPIIKITDKCNKNCKHCGYDCSYDNNNYITLDILNKNINILKQQNMNYIQLMGGELYLHPEYEQIINICCNNFKLIRLVTNGEWINDDLNFLNVLINHKDKLFTSISATMYHNNNNVNKINSVMSKNKLYYAFIPKISRQNIFPIGRAKKTNVGNFDHPGCTIDNVKQTFLIDENGHFYKCMFGLWKFLEYDDKIETFKNNFDSISSTLKIFLRGRNCIECQLLYKKYLKFINKENLYYNNYNIFLAERKHNE